MTTYIGLPLGIPGDDLLCLNDDSIWRGGPFANSVRHDVSTVIIRTCN